MAVNLVLFPDDLWDPVPVKRLVVLQNNAVKSMTRTCENNGKKMNSYTEIQKEAFGIHRMRNKRKVGREVILKAIEKVGNIN